MLKQKAVHIKNKLANPQITISDIIKEYSFSSPAHFTTYCKKQFGENPSKLRKELNSMR
ncbi:MAG: helix-turn-helix domain-containing protein [Tannerellaceae bacterium]|nr:helix-turn-helix domain-containing protein [Tannerellaceae bacterium]